MLNFDYKKHIKPALEYCEDKGYTNVFWYIPIKDEYFGEYTGLPNFRMQKQLVMEDNVTVKGDGEDFDFCQFFEKDIRPTCRSYSQFMLCLVLSIQEDERVYMYCPDHPKFEI